MSLSKSQTLNVFLTSKWDERAIYSSRRTAHSQRNIHKYVSMASTAQRRIVICAAITTKIVFKKTPSGCEVKRISVHGGCLGNQRR